MLNSIRFGQTVYNLEASQEEDSIFLGMEDNYAIYQREDLTVYAVEEGFVALEGEDYDLPF